MPKPAPMEVYPLRIPPGGEVTSLLQQTVSNLGLKAPFIVSCVGSVKSVILRFATDKEDNHAVSDRHENLEICSLVGTLSKDGYHLHGTFGNAKGVTVSGHIMGNMVVQTTAEIVIGNALGYEFCREFDNRTGFNELVVNDAKEEERSNKKSDSEDDDDIDVEGDGDNTAPLVKNAEPDKYSEEKDKNCGEPPVKRAKTQAFPKDEEIKTYVTKILEGANLEEITMKTVCKQVYENYPNHDLALKKDLIKDTVRSLIS